MPGPILESCSWAPWDNIISTQMDAGVPKRRRRFTAIGENFQCQMALTEAQLDTLLDFYDTTLFAVLPFDWYDWRKPSNTALRRSYRFKQRPSYVEWGANDFIATLELEIVSESFEFVATPVADFSATPLSGDVPLNVTFTDLSTNTPTSWAWDFGDGGTSTSQNPTHSYASAGTYTVSLVATNAGGSDTETKTSYVVAAFNPASIFGGSDQGGVIDFRLAARITQDDAGATPITTYGQTIGRALDQSGKGNNHTQATSTARAQWCGWPRTLGSDLVSNGNFASDTVWTKGTGWTIAGGVATKSAGTASVLSQSITLTAGKYYFIQFQVTRSAGTVLARFTGGTTVSGFSRNVRGGYYDMLLAVSGNTTLEFSADSAFAGTVFNVVVREVTSMVNVGALFDGSDDRTRSPAINMSGSNSATLVIAFRAGQSVANQTLSQFGVYPSQVRHLTAELSSRTAQFGDATNTAESLTGDDENRSRDGVLAIVYDADQATTTTQIVLYSRGYETAKTPSGTAVSAGALAAAGQWSLGSPHNNNSWLNGWIFRAGLINKILSLPDLMNLMDWAREGMCYGAVIGDSTVSINTAADPLPNSYSIASLVSGLICGSADVSDPGDRIADQTTVWNALPGKDVLECVFIQIGLNDVKGRVGANTATTADVISDLQTLVTLVRSDVPAGCKIYISQMTPCKGWLDAAANPTAAYAAWQDVNTAIAGGGATPITGVDGRITSFNATLDNGSGYLKAIYQTDSADYVHENSHARFIIAQAWRDQLEADGLV